MDAWVPFFQTLLWVLLIGASLWRFHTEVADVLGAIRDRVRKGSTIKAGPFELGESPPVQSEASQKREFIEEVREAADEAETAPQPQLLQNRAFLAEELAVRELQSEFGVSINRQVAVGPDSGLDGMFAKDGRGYGIEVKFTRRPLPSGIAIGCVQQLKLYTSRLGWHRFTHILAVVQDNPDIDRAAEQARLEGIIREIGNDVIVRVYSFAELARKYGLNELGQR